MAHNIESLFYTREKPWHGLGIQIQEAPTSAKAIRLAGLDWTVEAKPVFEENNIEIPNYKANTRNTDGRILGIVTDRYKIVQNIEAFSFTDEIVGDEVRYETAGSLQGGKKIWLLAKLPDTTVVGDAVEPYLCFTNSHDGSGSIRVCMTPIRVVCNNTLNIALRDAKRHWSTKHIGDMKSKLTEARQALELAQEYMYSLNKTADVLANTSISMDKIQECLDELFPVNEDDSDIKKNNVQRIKDEYMVCYFMPDLVKFQGTVWGVINAMCDMTNHNAPRRLTEKYYENNWERIIDGHPMVDAMVKRLCK